MILFDLFNNPLFALIWVATIVIAVTVHEFAHAYTADKLGDPTPGLMGRITLNPMAHLDPWGTVALLFVGFGWGRPVQFDPFNLENPKRDAAIISVAGPLSNLALVVIAALMFQIGLVPFSIASIFVHLNLVLALFNLIPVLPLDGFKIVGGLLSDDASEQWYTIANNGIYILILLILPILPNGSSIVSTMLGPVIGTLTSIILF